MKFIIETTEPMTVEELQLKLNHTPGTELTVLKYLEPDFGYTVRNVEIPNELFDMAFGLDHSSWSVDYEELTENEELKDILEYLQDNERDTLDALRDEVIQYIELYKDI